MARIASALFNDRTEAERAVAWLRDNGVPNDAITVIARNEGDDDGWSTTNNDRDASDGAAEAGSGLASGLGIGAGVGALFGLAAALIPGVGPLIVAGPLAAWLGGTAGAVAAGAIVGGTAGSLAGALSHWGLNEAEAHHYAGEVERGGTYVGVEMDRANLSQESIYAAFRSHHGTVQDDGFDTDSTTPLATTTSLSDTTPMATATPMGSGTPMAVTTAGSGLGYGAEMARDYTEETTVNTRVPAYQEELGVDKRTDVIDGTVVGTHPQTDRVDRDLELRRERMEVDEDTDDIATTTRRSTY